MSQEQHDTEHDSGYDSGYDTDETSVAVVGMAGRFPRAATVGDLWENLLKGERAIRTLDPDELRAAGVPQELIADPAYVPVTADLEDVDLFDADFFGIPGHEANLIDPQHRLFLETCWSALEDGAHLPGPDTRIGVFGSTSLSTYLFSLLTDASRIPADGISYPLLLGNDKDFLTTRVAHRIGLTGPAVTVQTACSSSLVAVHLAVQSLLAGECDLALAGGVSVGVPQQAGYLHRSGGILSPDGHCRVFDAEAAGTVRGSGCGVVLLRRLEDARTGQDRIDAVIRGTAVNNDGSGKAAFTAPSPAGQTEVIREALHVSGVDAADIGYVEAHGTGTALGDPIELSALTAGLDLADGTSGDCYLGSVKANLGHLDAAAGVTGLIKSVLVLRDQRVPVQADFRSPNPRLERHLDNYRVPLETVTPTEPLRAAAVSSFGLGGTNAHAVLTTGNQREDRPAPSGDYLLLLSARDASALRTLAERLRDHLARHPATRIDDVALTLAQGRTAYPLRAALRTGSVEDLGKLLDELDAEQPTVAPDAAAWAAGGPAPKSVGDLSHARRTALPGHPQNRRRHWAVPEPTATEGDLGVTEQAQAGPTPARQAMPREELATLARQTLGRMVDQPELGWDDDIYDFGLDSMGAVETVAALREATGLPLKFEEFDGLRTPAVVGEYLMRLDAEAAVAASAPPPGKTRPTGLAASGAAEAAAHRHLLSRIRPASTSGPGTTPGNIFLVPPAGGTVIAYADLALHIPAGPALWAMGYPVEAARDYRAVRDLARLYTALVREEQPEGPYTLAGYSFGGSVAFEMAAVLEAQGETVERIVMLDSHPPEAYIGGTADDRAFLEVLPQLVGEILPEVEAAPSADGTPEGAEAFIERISDEEWSPAMKAELLKFFRIWQDNHQALKRWYPDRRVRTDIHVLVAQEQENQTIMSALDIRRERRELWSSHTEGRLEVSPVPGDHYSMIRDPANLPELGKAFGHAAGLLS